MKKENGMRENLNVINVLMLIAAVVLWFLAPFMSTNYVNFNSRPSAFAMLTDPWARASRAYNLLAASTILFILACFICTLIRKNRLARGLALVGGLAYIWEFFYLLKWTNGYQFFEIFGVGFWALGAIFFAIAFFSGKWQAIGGK